MDRAELYMVERYKSNELRKKLKPITDWSAVRKGTKLFHDIDSNIYNDNVFISYDKKNNMIKYYEESEEYTYTMSATEWYYYDKAIADEVEELYTPKLYELDGMITVAFNKEEAWKYLKEKYNHIGFDYKNISDIKLINEVDGFEIVLK